MNFHRIQSLLRYDWTLQKRTISLAFIITTALYICLVFMFFMFKGILNFEGQDLEGLPVASAIFCNSFFSYAQIAMVLVVTQILHEKFTAPRTSLSYLTLPGTNTEKWLVMLLDYAIVAFALWILKLVMFDLTMFIGYCMAPDHSWTFNPFIFYFAQDEIIESVRNSAAAGDQLGYELVQTMIDKVMTPALSMSIFVNLFQLTIYIVLNMCFRTHGQLKTIACLIGASAVLGFVAIIMTVRFVVSYVGDVSPSIITEWIVGDGFSMANCIRWYYYSAPFLSAAMLYLFHWQICRKQAK